MQFYHLSAKRPSKLKKSHVNLIYWVTMEKKLKKDKSFRYRFNSRFPYYKQWLEPNRGEFDRK